MITFNSDFVLKQCLEQLYPWVDQILISEGCVGFWAKKGFTTSTDRTNEIIHSFPDPLNKIQIVHGVYKEKTDQSNAIMSLVDPETDYILQVDSDEVYKTADIIKLKEFLEEVKPTSIDIRSTTFYGSFDTVLTGFEAKAGNFHRVFKYCKGATWFSHRPPRLTCDYDHPLHVNGDELFDYTGITMMHYSYLFPSQVKQKMEYYSQSLNLTNCIPNYFENVYVRWVKGDKVEKFLVERDYRGLQEFIRRDDCYSAKFRGEHPESIRMDMKPLLQRLNKEIDAL